MLGGSPRLEWVKATASGGVSTNYAVAAINTTARLFNVQAEASGGTESIAIRATGTANLTLVGVDVVASGGTSSLGLELDSPAKVFAKHSSFDGTDAAVNAPSGTSASIAYSRLIGGAVGVPGSFNCLGAYKVSFVALDANCD